MARGFLRPVGSDSRNPSSPVLSVPHGSPIIGLVALQRPNPAHHPLLVSVSADSVGIWHAHHESLLHMLPAKSFVERLLKLSGKRSSLLRKREHGRIVSLRARSTLYRPKECCCFLIGMENGTIKVDIGDSLEPTFDGAYRAIPSAQGTLQDWGVIHRSETEVRFTRNTRNGLLVSGADDGRPEAWWRWPSENFVEPVCMDVGKRLVAVGFPNRIEVMQHLGDGKIQSEIEALCGRVNAVRIQSIGSVDHIFGVDASACVYRSDVPWHRNKFRTLDAPPVIRRLDRKSGVPITLTSNKDVVVVGGSNGTVTVLNHDLREIVHHDGHIGRVNAVSLDPVLNRVYSGGEDGTIRMFNYHVDRDVSNPVPHLRDLRRNRHLDL